MIWNRSLQGLSNEKSSILVEFLSYVRTSYNFFIQPVVSLGNKTCFKAVLIIGKLFLLQDHEITKYSFEGVRLTVE